mmetsp:Transcript_9123/g.16615  ORF Transcript_9123/g.16615 Transcript_9123/m.16615 type:complete len:108 (+) Transcript_9123:217-540(+)
MPGVLDNIIVGAVAAAVPFANETISEGWQAMQAVPGVNAAQEGWEAFKQKAAHVPDMTVSMSTQIMNKSALVCHQLAGALSGRQFKWLGGVSEGEGQGMGQVTLYRA